MEVQELLIKLELSTKLVPGTSPQLDVYPLGSLYSTRPLPEPGLGDNAYRLRPSLALALERHR